MGSKQHPVFSIPQRPISGLDGGIVAQGVDADQHGVKDRQLGNSRYMGLKKHRDLIGIQSHRQVVNGHVIDTAADEIRIFKMGGQRLDIGQEDKGVVLLLQFDSALEAAHIVADVELAGGAVSGEYAFFGFHSRSPLSK